MPRMPMRPFPEPMEIAMNENWSVTKIATIAIGVFAVLLVMSTFFGSWYTVDASQRGVLLHNGAFQAVVDPGLHFKLPWVDSVVMVDMQTHTQEIKDMEAYSSDQQPATLRFSVTYHVNPDRVSEMYTRFGGRLDAAVARIILPAVNKDVKIVFGQYTAQRSVSQRAQLNADIGKALDSAFSADPTFIIESTQLEDFQFNKDYIHSVEQRMQAEVEVQKFQQNLEREKVEANIKATRADGEARSILAVAKARADATVLNGDAEAKAIEARAKALGNNPLLIELTQAEKWDGKVPTTMLPNASVPMLSLNMHKEKVQ